MPSIPAESMAEGTSIATFLSILQRTLGNGEVMQPVCSNINQIYIITFAEFFVSFVTGIDGGFGHGCLSVKSS